MADGSAPSTFRREMRRINDLIEVTNPVGDTWYFNPKHTEIVSVRVVHHVPQNGEEQQPDKTEVLVLAGDCGYSRPVYSKLEPAAFVALVDSMSDDG